MPVVKGGRVRFRRAAQKTSRPTLIEYIDKIVGVPVRVKHQVPTALVRGTTDACDSDVQEDPWSAHRSSTLTGSVMSEL